MFSDDHRSLLWSEYLKSRLTSFFYCNFRKSLKDSAHRTAQIQSFWYKNIQSTLFVVHMSFPRSSTDNIQPKCLKFCGMQWGSTLLQATALQAVSFNIVGWTVEEYICVLGSHQHIFLHGVLLLGFWHKVITKVIIYKLEYLQCNTILFKPFYNRQRNRIHKFYIRVPLSKEAC